MGRSQILKAMAAIFLAISIQGCVPGIVSEGHDFDLAKAEALVPSVTTLEDAKAQVGEPFSEETSADGSVLVKWVYGANGFVGVHVKGIAILFGPDHKMIRVTKLMNET